MIFAGVSDQNLHFYQRYDERFLFNKVATFLYIIDEGAHVVTQIQQRSFPHVDASFSARYQESLRAEILFSTLHQCESFFALLVALFQPLPHWLYLTTYETKEIKQAVERIVARRIEAVTNGAISTTCEFISVTVYTEVMTADPELAGRWEENLDNAAWLIERIGIYFLRYDRVCNSYKHGLRVMTGPHRVGIAPQGWDGAVQGPMRVIQASEDSLTYLQKEPVREVAGRKKSLLPRSQRPSTRSKRRAI